ncbi:MAG: hypothetical protein IJR54_03270, partial [Oscillibacter sp.]|nr:hypothetical protein [Oscillibacter sp.]
GYTVSVRVKDSKGRTVTVTKVNDSTSTFVMPENMPVTVTVTYSKLSSSSSSSNSGGSTGGGGGGGGGGQTQTTTYYLTVSASVTPTAGGTVYLQKDQPQNGDVIKTTASGTFQQANESGKSVTVRAVFVPNDNYTFTSATSTNATVGATNTVTVKRTADGPEVTATWVNVTADGDTDQTKAPSVSVTGTFTTGSGTPIGDLNWTIKTEIVGAYVFLTDDETKVPTAAVTQETAVTTLTTKVANNGNGKVWLAISPEPGFSFDTNKPTADNANVNGVPDGATLRVYTIEKSNITATNNQTLVEGALAVDMTKQSAATYAVTVTPKLYEVDADGKPLANTPRNLTDADTEVPRPSADTPATAGQMVTVKVPYTTGYGEGYRLRVDGISVAGATTTPTVKPVANSDTEYTFRMPNEPVEVTVVYEKNPDEDLLYTVEVDFDGEGSMVVNIAGKDYALPDRAYVTDETNGVYGIAVTMKQSEFLKKYPDTDVSKDGWKVPVYVTNTPIASNGYTYSNQLTFNGARQNVGKNTAFQLERGPNQILRIKVAFDKVKTYGYNLTIIGKGSVDVTFNNKTVTHTNTEDTPQTFTSGSVEINASNVALRVATPVPANSAYEYDALEASVTVNGTEQAVTGAYGQDITLQEGAMLDLVVSIHEKDRVAIPFNVYVGNNGKVTVKAENGSLVPNGNVVNQADAQTALDNKASTLVKSEPLTGEDRGYYYAYSGTVITLVPEANASYKTYSVKVNGDEVSDELSSTGFSFTLKEETRANVRFGAFNTNSAYSALLQAPFIGTPNGLIDLHSQSTNINALSGDSGHKLSQLLDSLNNGASKDGIDNNVGNTFANLNKITDEFLNRAKNKDGETGRQALQRMLEENVQRNLGDNLSRTIEREKETLMSGDTPATIEGNLKTALTMDNPPVYSNVPVTGEAKASVIKTILGSNSDLNTAYTNGDINDNSFTITATVEPVLTIQDETGIADLKDKSLEKQLQFFIMDYLRNLKLDPSYKDNLPEAKVKVNVKGYDENGNRIDTVTAIPSELTVSATAQFTTLPELDKTLKFDSYVKQLSIWVKTTLSVQVVRNGNTESVTVNPQAFPISKFENSSAVDKTALDNTISGNLASVDQRVTAIWNETLKGSSTKTGLLDSTNTLKVPMGNVLTKDMLDDVVEDNALNSIIEKLIGKFESLKRGEDAPATRAAFMNLYRDFVLFNEDNTDRLLTLKTRSNDESTYPVVGKVDGDNLVVTLDFEQLLKDTATPSDSTPYEKLMDLMIAFRDGMATDIRLSDHNTTGQTAQSVVADLIYGQIQQGKSGAVVTATKWGTSIVSSGSGGRSMTTAERKELANLLAELIMAPLDTSVDAAWQKFESKGYQSVTLAADINALKRASVSQLVQAMREQLGAVDNNANSIRFGLQVTQNITPPAET